MRWPLLLCNHIQPVRKSQPRGLGGKWSSCSIALQHCAAAAVCALLGRASELSLSLRQGAGGAPSPASHLVHEARPLANDIQCLTCEKGGKKFRTFTGTAYSMREMLKQVVAEESPSCQNTSHSSKDNAFLV